MSRKLSQAEIDRDRIKNDYYCMHEALQAVMEGEHIRIGQFTCDGWTITGWLINPDRAHGGLIMLEQKPSKASKIAQKPDYSVYMFEQYYREVYAKLGSSDYVRELLVLLEKAHHHLSRNPKGMAV